MDHRKIVIEECGPVDVLIDGEKFHLLCDYIIRGGGEEQVYVEEDGNRVVVERVGAGAIAGFFSVAPGQVKELFDYIGENISGFVCWEKGVMENHLAAAKKAGGKYPAIDDSLEPAGRRSFISSLRVRMRPKLDDDFVNRVCEHIVPVVHVVEQEPEPEFEKVCKCKACGTEIDIEDEEGLWGHLQMEHEEIFEECMDWDTPDVIDEYYDVLSVIKVTELDEGIGEVLTLEAARKDIVEYLGQQENDYFSERGTTKEQVIGDQELIENLAVEHMRCVNRYGNEREWSCKDACDVEPGFYMDKKDSLSEQIKDAEEGKEYRICADFSSKDDFER